MYFLDTPIELQDCFQIKDNKFRWNMNSKNIHKIVKLAKWNSVSFKIHNKVSVSYLICEIPRYTCAPFEFLRENYPNITTERNEDTWQCQNWRGGGCTPRDGNYACFKINDNYACFDCFNYFMECYKSFKLISTNVHLSIFKLFVHNPKQKQLDGAACKFGSSYIFYGVHNMTSINSYHPKTNICLLTNEEKCLYFNDLKCAFTSFYFEKYKLIKSIENVVILKDIVGSILESFMDVCMNYNYTDCSLFNK